MMAQWKIDALAGWYESVTRWNGAFRSIVQNNNSSDKGAVR
ncbi:MAG: hypothetical protein WCK53_12490 [Methanomicrobiales archaeon]